MAFDEYQFLRYFIPGSLYVIYSAAMTATVLNPEKLDFFKNNPDVLLGIVGGAFGAALAMGYLIYTFYDTFHYNHWAMNRNRRGILTYLESRIADWKLLDDARKKEFIDLLWITLNADSLSERYSALVKGIWSHLNARKVCCYWVPSFSVFTLFLLYLFSNIVLRVNLFTMENWVLFALVLAIIGGISAVLWFGEERPLDEGTTIEYYFIQNRIETNPVEFEDLVHRILGMRVVD